mmetsp:Transcript_19684/g.78258  ORF Transcript_19684/g.78258 Transcript_19684/m.78258 type:complete len:200 (+) Transcript_19684:999-1598(+)
MRTLALRSVWQTRVGHSSRPRIGLAYKPNLYPPPDLPGLQCSTLKFPHSSFAPPCLDHHLPSGSIGTYSSFLSPVEPVHLLRPLPLEASCSSSLQARSIHKTRLCLSGSTSLGRDLQSLGCLSAVHPRYWNHLADSRCLLESVCSWHHLQRTSAQWTSDKGYKHQHFRSGTLSSTALAHRCPYWLSRNPSVSVSKWIHP